MIQLLRCRYCGTQYTREKPEGFKVRCVLGFWHRWTNPLHLTDVRNP